MNIESILAQFKLVEASISRARLAFDVELLAPEVMEVSMYELMKAREQMANMIREIGYPRFESVLSNVMHTPAIEISALHLCPFCGDPKCQSDHK